MQSAHEQCFLCKRAHPDRYIYYKDYTELEGDLFTTLVLGAPHAYWQLCVQRQVLVCLIEGRLL